jgi:CobQ-like glutamine amidotransferase family enzyme
VTGFSADRPLRVVVVYPDLLGTYGDGGNGLVLTRRAGWRGIPAELLEAPSDAPLPTGDIYTLGGGEDGPQVQATECLAEDGTLARAVGDGAVVFAVCAGYQIVGTTFPAADGSAVTGLGLLDVATVKGGDSRAVGEIVVEAELPGAGRLTGFENHGGVTALGPGVRPLGRVRVGVGNGDHTDGAVAGRIVGTYLHGPALARNPVLADLLLSWATGQEELAPLDDHREEALRAERFAAALPKMSRLRGRHGQWRDARSHGPG